MALITKQNETRRPDAGLGCGRPSSRYLSPTRRCEDARSRFLSAHRNHRFRHGPASIIGSVPIVSPDRFRNTRFGEWRSRRWQARPNLSDRCVQLRCYVHELVGLSSAIRGQKCGELFQMPPSRIRERTVRHSLMLRHRLSRCTRSPLRIHSFDCPSPRQLAFKSARGSRKG